MRVGRGGGKEEEGEWEDEEEERKSHVSSAHLSSGERAARMGKSYGGSGGGSSSRSSGCSLASWLDHIRQGPPLCCHGSAVTSQRCKRLHTAGRGYTCDSTYSHLQPPTHRLKHGGGRNY